MSLREDIQAELTTGLPMNGPYARDRFGCSPANLNATVRLMEEEGFEFESEQDGRTVWHRVITRPDGTHPKRLGHPEGGEPMPAGRKKAKARKTRKAKTAPPRTRASEPTVELAMKLPKGISSLPQMGEPLIVAMMDLGDGKGEPMMGLRNGSRSWSVRVVEMV